MKKLLLTLLVAICLFSAASLLYAEDLNKYYAIASPEYFKEISFANQQFPFLIVAPKGWYMAQATSDQISARAFFSKSDPKESLSQGRFPIPSIGGEFISNPKGLTADAMSSDLVSQMKSSGRQILLEPQDIYADKNLGSHYTGLDPKKNIIWDACVFKGKKAFVFVMVTCKYAEFEGLKASIKEAVDSIKFSIF